MVIIKRYRIETPLCECGAEIHNNSHTQTPPHSQLPRIALRTTENSQDVSYRIGHVPVKPGGAFHASRIVKKYKRSRLRRVKRQEYQKLRDMVPSLNEKSKVTKVEVIEETIKYIDELHDALIERFRTRGLPPTLVEQIGSPVEVNEDNIRDLVRHLLASSNPASLPPSRIENTRILPSFVQKFSRSRRI